MKAIRNRALSPKGLCPRPNLVENERKDWVPKAMKTEREALSQQQPDQGRSGEASLEPVPEQES